MERSTPAHNRELNILNAIAEALATAPDVRQALERTLALVADLFGLRTGWVWLYDAESEQFYNAAAQELPPYLQEPVRMTGRTCRCLDLFREGKLTPANFSVVECSRLWKAWNSEAEEESEAAQGLRYHASIPLFFQERPLGVMNVAGPEGREISAEELRLLATIAYHVGTTIERARLAEESARLVRLEERARIARDIHDTLAQSLTAIGLSLESALHHLETDRQRARSSIERSLSLTRESLDEARRAVQSLRAAPLEGRPLAEALHSLARTFTAETGVRTRVEIQGKTTGNTGSTGRKIKPRRARRDTENASRIEERRESFSLASGVEVELYRIAQEALTNVARHAKATEVTLTLQADEESVCLVVRDNGEGLAEGGSRTEGHGLLGMRERARLCGGTLRLSSRAGKGTTVTVQMPLNSGMRYEV
jgi:two-component system NarL family sensor kinase